MPTGSGNLRVPRILRWAITRFSAAALSFSSEKCIKGIPLVERITDCSRVRLTPRGTVIFQSS